MPSQPMHMANSFDPASATTLDPATASLLRRRDRVMGAAYRLFYEQPLQVSTARGALLYDAAGVEHLDAYNNVPSVGHSNPRVRAAVDAALERVNTHTRYLDESVVDYAERLTALFPPPLSQVVFTCSGSEAVDLAARVAQHATGRRGWIVTAHAYHGTTAAAAALSPSLGANNRLPEHVEVVEAPDQLRDGPGAARAFADRVARAAEQLAERGTPVAGLLVDSCLSSDGLQLEPAGFLAPAVEEVRRRGGLYVADEVQPGFGRLGGLWWGFQRHHVLPDLVVLGKPMGNGLPISAVIARPDLLSAFGHQVRYFNTFGGTPATVAAAGAVLDEIEQHDLLTASADVGRVLREGIAQVCQGDDRIGQVRGSGLFVAVEVVTDADSLQPDPRAAAALVNGLRARRILVSASGDHAHVLKVRPPLVFQLEHADRFVTGLQSVLEQR